MELTASTLPYIEGKEFKDMLPMKVKQAEGPQDRMDFVEGLIDGKSVLHIGCLDHVPLIQNRLNNNRWLHGRISQSASECLGIDINREGVDFVRSELQISNVCYGDITDPNKIEEITSKCWDYVVFGEVIEHVDSPVLFLQKFVSIYGSYIDRIVITVPNAFKASNIRLAFKSLEVINSDHRYWFTPYTIWKVVHQAGLQAESIQMCKFDHTGNAVRERVRDFVLRRIPLLAEDIVVICRQP